MATQSISSFFLSCFSEALTEQKSRKKIGHSDQENMQEENFHLQPNQPFYKHFSRVNSKANEKSDLANPYPPESPFSINTKQCQAL